MGRNAWVAGWFMILGLLGGVAGEEPTTRRAAPLSLRIVPTRHREEFGRSIDSYPFHVVISNVSDQPVRLWREWCSWGYFNLSFLIEDEEGRTTVVRKRPRAWRKNLPDWTIVPPGDHMVFEVTFDNAIWENVSPPNRVNVKPRIAKMKAVYAVPDGEEAREPGVWTGRVASPMDRYAMYR